MDGRMGTNVNGPSLIRVPDWVTDPLGRYYLYFADHGGSYIRMAYADRLDGPWRTYEPGVLDIADSFFEGHIASPDAHVDDDRRQVRMYFHGHGGPGTGGRQRTRLAQSADGIHFEARPEILGRAYFRVWQWGGMHYALGSRGHIFRSSDGIEPFESRTDLPLPKLRHSALQLRGHMLAIYYSIIGDCPEHIVRSTMDLRPDWADWDPTPPETVLKPETPYEGVGLPLEPSTGGYSPEPVRQLRDPAIFEEDDRTYLLYSVAGESGIAIANIVGDTPTSD